MTNRPQGIGCLIFLTLIFGLFQIIFAVLVLQQKEIIGQFAFPVEIQAGIAVLWSGCFFLITVALVRHKAYAVRYGGWLIIAFIIYNLLRQMIFVQADYDRNRMLFVIILTLAIIIIPLLLLLSKQAEDSD